MSNDLRANRNWSIIPIFVRLPFQEFCFFNMYRNTFNLSRNQTTMSIFLRYNLDNQTVLPNSYSMYSINFNQLIFIPIPDPFHFNQRSGQAC